MKCYSYRGAPIEERLRSRVTISTDGCWIWAGTANRHGYGMITVRKKLRIATRVSWETFRGPIPQGLFVLHRCDVPACINPDHLFIGTQKDNCQDCIQKGRWPHIQRNVKLTQDQVKEIKSLRGQPQPIIAARFGIHQSQVSRILSGKRWGIAA